MRIRSLIFSIISLLYFQLNSKAQIQRRIIRTGAIFQRISPDARAGGMGDMGVATTPDAFSQYWNAAKYPFSRNYSSGAIAYTPYLSKVTNDIFLLNGSFNTFLDQEQRSTLSASVYYFKIGNVELRELIGNEIVDKGTAQPNEFSLDFSYGLKLSDFYAMAVSLRYIRSDLFNSMNNFDANKYQDVKAGNSLAVDLGGYYEGEASNYRSFNGVWRWGFNISNIGPKLSYSLTETRGGFYLPTNLRLGSSYEFIFDEANQFSLGLELNKLLVPTPGKDGKIPEKNLIRGIVDSFSDAPDGVKEELQEITYSLGLEYTFNKALKFRGGYFYEALEKGGRQYATVGLGMAYNDFNLDASYLVPTGATAKNNPLANSLRFALTWNFGGSVDNY